MYPLRNKDSFNGEMFLATHQTLKPEDHPPCRRSAIVYSIYLQLSPHMGDLNSILNLRTRRAVMT